jgi:TetR/AcrR family transcriptional repressor of nem operon
MARQKEFDPEEVLDKAVALFRQCGYAATGVEDLVSHLGIGRGSLYATFGSKHGLYLAALDRYRALSAQGQTAPDPALPAREAIAQIFARQIDTALRDGPSGGCLLVNSAVELAQHDPEVARRVQRDLADAEALFAALLSADPAFVHSGRDARVVARLLVNVSIGLRFQAKITPDRATLEDIVAGALAAVG